MPLAGKWLDELWFVHTLSIFSKLIPRKHPLRLRLVNSRVIGKCFGNYLYKRGLCPPVENLS